MTFCGNLRLYRKAHGMTQAALAAALGIKQSTISSWERGTREPDLSSLARLAALFGVTTDALLGLAAPSRSVDVSNLTDADAATVQRVADALRPMGRSPSMPAASSAAAAVNS